MERFRDELGDWRLVLHSPYGARVHAPWALAIAARLRERYADMDVQALHTDDGIVLRVPDADEPPQAGIAEFDADELEPLITAELGGSALFASRFRECAARALLLPRRQPGRRSPLWQQRQRSAHLLAVAARYGTFPIVLETVRECVQDVFDVPALTGLMRDLASRKVRLVEVETPAPSPFGKSLLFRYVGAFMYEGDSPLAERRAQALALDSSLLAELLGGADLRELLDPEAVEQTQNELQRLAPGRACRDLEAVADLLRTIGPLSAAEVADRCTEPGAAPSWLAELAAQRRVIEVRISGEGRWARSRTRAAARRARRAAAGRRARRVHRAGARPAGRPGGPVRALPWPVHHRRRGGPLRPRAGGRHRRVCGGWRRRAGSARVSSGPAAGAPNGATPRCCGCCGAAAWPGSARRPSRSRRRSWARSCPPGRTQASGPGADRERPNRQPPPARPDAVYDAVEQLAGVPVPARAGDADAARPGAGIPEWPGWTS